MSKIATQTITQLKKEVHLLRSFVIGFAGKDREGGYRPEFVERILRASEERPVHTLEGRDTFLSQLKKYSR